MRSQQPVKAGSGWVTASPMVDSSVLLKASSLEAARQRLAKDGYLLLRGYLPEHRVLQVCSARWSHPCACMRSIFWLTTQARTFLLQELRAWKPESLSSDTDDEVSCVVTSACRTTVKDSITATSWMSTVPLGIKNNTLWSWHDKWLTVELCSVSRFAFCREWLHLECASWACCSGRTWRHILFFSRSWKLQSYTPSWKH